MAPKKVSTPEVVDAPNTPGMITVAQAARLLVLTETRVRQLCSQGYIPRPKRATVPLVGAVQGYIKFLREEDRRSSKSAADSKLKDTREREIALRIAQKDRTLIDLDEHLAVVADLCGRFGSALEGLPANVTRDITLRRKIEINVDEIRRQLALSVEQSSAKLRAGRSALDADTEDDLG